ncbi:alpha/beta hydrolase [Streptomyces sp. MBT42]|uniref:alpha/beta hydrolase n=1 Tax=Streptomyces sp. MBT42 TaxID=1488373 RepID=UPI001E455B92|nr:alpha/beta fold hydrolase [Streptomyces sp. MBT42]MCD2467105.1 alpha/beta hydrolase [Streptomyces sp. MBT42]
MRAPSRPTFVCVHGGSSNARAWGPLQNELALLGHRSYAVDLPGHGARAEGPAAYYRQPQDLAALAAAPSPMSGVTLRDNVRHVTGVLRRLAPLGPVVLVGHSLGGLTIGAVADAVPDLVDRVVYLSAFCLADPAMLTGAWDVVDENLLDAAVARIAVPLTGESADPGVVRLNWRAAHADPAVFAELKAAVMADSTDRAFGALLDTLDPDENHGVLEPGALVTAERWGRVPRTYVRLSGDASITPAVQDHMIRKADELTPRHPFDVHTLDTSHVGYFSRPALFAELLAGLV